RFMELASAAHKAVGFCARLKEGENVLVLADTAVDRNLVEAFAEAACILGGQTQVMLMETRPEINMEPPLAVAAAMEASDLVLDLLTQYIIHTDAYLRVRKSGTRILCGTGLTEDMAIRLIGQVDYGKLVERGKRLTRLFEKSEECRVETALGTSLRMSVKGRPILLRDGLLEGPGDLDYMPGAQVSLAAVEETINGKLVVDGSLYPPVGLLDSPVTLALEKGRVVDVQGGAQARAWQEWLEKFKDPKMFCQAHISIGLNPGAKLTGNILEDERAAGAFVMGFGSQMEYFKGTVGKASSHTDSVVLAPHIYLDGQPVVEGGRFVGELA
ncbi:MAG: aminopeptidase, partial [Anaerolineae bacterium]